MTKEQLERPLDRRDVRRLLHKPLASLGYGNLAQSVTGALLASRGGRGELPRQLLPRMWRRLGTRKAVVCHDRAASFEELTDRSVRLASALHALGLRPKDRVGTLLRNEQAWFETMLACMLTGYKMPMLNTHLRPAELAQCVNSCAPRVLVFSGDLLDVVEEVRDQLDSVEALVCTGDGPLPSGIMGFDELLARGTDTLPPGRVGLPHMPFSGGSTGVPKFIVDAARPASPKSASRA